MAVALKFAQVAATAKHSATVIFVHGLGDTGDGWRPVGQMFGRDPTLKHVKWIFPHAPTRPITANYGMQMPGWFDIESFDFTTEDEKGMLETVMALNKLITDEVDAGIPANRIVLGGFSQGGAMSLLTGLTTERRLAGVAVLSGWLPLKTKFKAMVSDHVKQLPIFWGHGEQDPLVKFIWGQESAQFLKVQVGVTTSSKDSAGIPVGLSFNSYKGLVHSANDEELADLQSWLVKVVPAQH